MSQSDLYIAWWQNLHSGYSATDGATVRILAGSAGTHHVSYVYSTAAGGWLLRITDSAGASTSSVVLAEDRWQRIVVRFQLASAGLGSRSSWLDGIADLAVTGLSNAGSISALQVGVVAGSGSVTATIDLDEIKIGTSYADVQGSVVSGPWSVGEAAPCAQTTLIVTRRGDADSEAWGEYYRSARSIPRAHWCRVPCTANENLADYATFQAEVETPLGDWLNLNTAVAANITTIVLGYHVPGSFSAGGSNYSAASRLMRLGSARSARTTNPLYDATGASVTAATRLTRAALDAAGVAYLVHRMDGPTLADAEALVDRAVALEGVTLAGTLWIDPYGLQGAGYEGYEDELESWANGLLRQRLKLATELSAASDPGSNVVFDELTDDDAYFGWHSTTGSADFFGDQGSGVRALFYDGDSYAMTTLRSVATSRWCPLALAAGYALTAGPTDEPLVTAALRPGALFESLRVGHTWAEAFCLATPYIDDFMTAAGDPLAVVAFPLAGWHGYRRPGPPTGFAPAELIAAAPPGVAAVTLPPLDWSAGGQWTLELRPVDSAGNELADPHAVRCVALDASGQLFPPAPAPLRSLTVQPTAGARLAVAWRYVDAPGGVAAERFEIFVGPATGQSPEELLAIGAAAEVSVDAGEAGLFGWTSLPLATGQSWRVGVRAASAGAAGPVAWRTACTQPSEAPVIGMLIAEVR
ncbi:MAG: hypothetical protein BIFFINMI_02916 [Phycisphaerae bacterium]|nr:hypothetical protein [Phycisphaerae bacterium]